MKTAKAEPKAKPRPAGKSADEMGKQQREISVSEFFTKNRHLLGFDNPRKALLTCVKEAVDNALDASEEAGILPDVAVRAEAAQPRARNRRIGRKCAAIGIVAETDKSPLEFIGFYHKIPIDQWITVDEIGLFRPRRGPAGVGNHHDNRADGRLEPAWGRVRPEHGEHRRKTAFGGASSVDLKVVVPWAEWRSRRQVLEVLRIALGHVEQVAMEQ